jgi:hypothetical protein
VGVALFQLNNRSLGTECDLERREQRRARDMMVPILSLGCSILISLYARHAGKRFWIHCTSFCLSGGPLLLCIAVYTSRQRSTSQPDALASYR